MFPVPFTNSTSTDAEVTPGVLAAILLGFGIVIYIFVTLMSWRIDHADLTLVEMVKFQWQCLKQWRIK